MLTDKQIDALCAQIMWRIDAVNDEYLQTVGDQINAIGKLNPSSIRKLAQMRKYGANSAKIKKKLQEALNMSADEVQGILDRAAQEEYKNYDFLGVQRGRSPIPIQYNYGLQTFIKALAAQTAETFRNYSNTTSVGEEYKEVVSQAVDAVARGVTDYNQAIRSSIRKLGGDGLRVTYESGVTRRMDSAIRMNILDSVRQVSTQAAKMAGEEIGADGVELSAHPFSALDHEDIQGRMFSAENYEKMQSGQPFEDVDGKQYDPIRRPITQWNCRHFASPVILCVSKRRYTDEQLAQWKSQNHTGCDIDGKHYTVYQASQLMRKLETEVRRQKDIANLAKASGDDVLRREAQAKIVGLRAKYNHVAEQAKLRVRPDKMVLESYKNYSQKGNESAFTEDRNSAILNVQTPEEGMRMPNAITASTTQNKIQGYFLNSNHPVGKHKAAVMNSVMGYHYQNWDELSDIIYNKLQTSVVASAEQTEYGIKYKVPMRIDGKKDKSMVLNTVWQADNGSIIPRLVTITFDKRTIKELK